MRDRAQLLRMLGVLVIGGFFATLFIVPPVLGLLPKRSLGFIPTGFPVRLEFYVSLLVLVAGTALLFAVGRRRPPGTPLTWGEAMVGATFVFGLMLVGYGLVPNEWLKWADNQLLWRPDRIWFAISSKFPVFFTGGNAATEAAAGRGRIIVSFQALRDIIAATIYILMLAAHVWLWIAYQKRGQKAATTDVTPRTSMFGRPVVKA